jgi:hypothetical protein
VTLQAGVSPGYVACWNFLAVGDTSNKSNGNSILEDNTLGGRDTEERGNVIALGTSEGVVAQQIPLL